LSITVLGKNHGGSGRHRLVSGSSIWKSSFSHRNSSRVRLKKLKNINFRDIQFSKSQLVALGGVATLAVVGYVATRKTSTSYRITIEVSAPAIDVFKYFQELDTYYEMNRKGYKTEITQRSPNEIQYNLVDEPGLGVRIVTPVIRKFHENSTPKTMDEFFPVMKSNMELHYKFYEEAPKRTRVVLDVSIEGPRASVALLLLSRKELAMKFDLIVKKFQQQ